MEDTQSFSSLQASLILSITDEYTIMNAFDKQKKNFTAQCEDCDEVFDILPLANMHSSSTGHKIKVTEFWVIGNR